MIYGHFRLALRGEPMFADPPDSDPCVSQLGKALFEASVIKEPLSAQDAEAISSRLNHGAGSSLMACKRREAAAAILFAEDGRLLLQQRDDIPGILHPGKVGLFGGHREGDEAFLDCIAREIYEEIGCRLPTSKFEHLASRFGPDPDVAGGVVHGEIFVARNIPLERLIVCEGTLVVMQPSAISEIARKLVPSAHFALECFGFRLQ